MDHGEHIFVWSLRRTVSSCRITCQIITTAVQVYKPVWAGLVSTACMRRRADITIIFSYKFKIIIVHNKKAISNRKTKPMVETKTAQYVHDIELHFTEKKKDTNKKIKKISVEIKRM